MLDLLYKEDEDEDEARVEEDEYSFAELLPYSLMRAADAVVVEAGSGLLRYEADTFGADDDELFDRFCGH